MKILLVFVLIVLSLHEAKSWTERGNGGNSIICNRQSKNMFFDAYEARYRHGFKIEYVNIEQDCSSNKEICFPVAMFIAREFIDRIRVESPDHQRFKSFMVKNVEKFSSEIKKLKRIEIIPVDDIGIGITPRGCTIKQTVVQRAPVFPTDKRYIISADYWDSLSPNHQAIGIVHELLYYYATTQGDPRSSEKIRYFNALLISNEISRLDSETYNKIFRNVFFNARDTGI